MNTKRILVPALIVAALGAGAIFKVSLTEAAANPRTDMIQYLAQKLGLDQSKVQSAFDSYHSEQRAARQQQMTDRLTTYLDGLVKQGKITEAQKTAILAKHSELQQIHETTDWSTKTPEERRTAMEKQRADLEAWAKKEGIDISFLQFGFGGRGMGKGMMGREFGEGRGMMRGGF